MNVELGTVARLSDKSNIDFRLSKIPMELHPVVNRIALKLAEAMNWDCAADLGVANAADIDFVNSEDLRAVRFARWALVAMCELQEFCLDEWGTSLKDLVDKEK